MSTIQEVFERFYPDFRNHYGLFAQQAKAAVSILNCRTAAFGGRVCECDTCEFTQVLYNSCRNRHCPTCQGIAKSVWVDQRSADLLDAPYFHVVFTVPEELHPLIYQNQRTLYALLYKAVSETLTELCGDPKYLGVQAGFFAVLHTWGQDLHYHPHLHVVMLAGGLTPHSQWRSSSKKFFLPVKVLSKVFRGKYLYHLKQAYRQNLLEFYGSVIPCREPKAFRELLNQCYAKNWYTYTRRTFSGPLAVIKYLANYTHRIAISNSRIQSMDEESVTFTVKDYQNESKTKTITLSGVEFIRRFLLHTLPKGFVKIRYYGILANRNRKIKLALCRKLTRSRSYRPRFTGLKATEVLFLLTGKDVTVCPKCQGKLRIRTLPPGASP
jgi:hypothetical protein